MTNTESLAAQVIANMSPEMKASFIAASTEDQTGLATGLAIESLKNNLNMQLKFQTNRSFRSLVENATFQILQAWAIHQ